MQLLRGITVLTALYSPVLGGATFHANPFHNSIGKRDTNSSSPYTVDLGYAVYEGYFDVSKNLNTFKGIRFAAPPTGSLRWQLPRPPVVDRSQVFQANQWGAQCPQAFKASGISAAAQQTFLASFGPASEDCLFLNVYAPANATNLPVFVWIHGGGYGFGNGQQDLSSLMNANNNGFIGVTIQYRLGAFGFLASDEVRRSGVTNAGLRDQLFALQWVQSYIHLFGGNASQVTIAGESAGAGSVMLQSMAFGGELGESFFSNAIVASPYLPMQYEADAWVPSQAYYALAEHVGCFTGVAVGNSAQKTIFQCLVNTNSSALISANSFVSASGMYGTWAFAPVTDGTFIKETPSYQLLHNKVNGVRILSGNNAEEGAVFVPQNITTEAALVTWLHDLFPFFTDNDIAKVLLHYPALTSNIPEVRTAAGPRLNSTIVAAIQQKRANDIYGETTITCPSYWLAEAYSTHGRTAFKYQYSVLPALHGLDVNGYFGPSVPYQSPEFVRYFQRIWGNFIICNDPSVPAAGENASEEAIAEWPVFSDANPLQINLNQTGGQLTSGSGAFPLQSYGNIINVDFYVGGSLEPAFSEVNAYEWDGGRGGRCDFWRSMGSVVPE